MGQKISFATTFLALDGDMVILELNYKPCEDEEIRVNPIFKDVYYAHRNHSTLFR